MTLRPMLRSSLTLALAFAAGAAWAEHPEANPNVAEVKPGDTVEVVRLPEQIFLRSQNDPDDIIWNRVPLYRTHLLPAPPVHESVRLRFDDGAMRGKHLYFQVARTSERFYVRLRWKDESEDRANSVDGFSDGVAVQYALNGVDTSYMMGTGPEKPVNIWYWRADLSDVENLAAGGFGSTMLLPEQEVSGAGAYVEREIAQDSEWQVVMSRPLEAEGEHEVSFDGESVPVSFAVWQGSDHERDGNKRITHTWILLDTGSDD
ncbi:ethylbenzene dehydrogenase-related protein [Halomonas sp. HK25]|uniref:ethylbenzene dehydrogenase-related protein n=1 Tax=Halomonas sp. HK25 TaxID=3394321 RepID=UPI0039FBD4F5